MAFAWRQNDGRAGKAIRTRRIRKPRSRSLQLADKGDRPIGSGDPQRKEPLVAWEEADAHWRRRARAMLAAVAYEEEERDVDTNRSGDG